MATSESENKDWKISEEFPSFVLPYSDQDPTRKQHHWFYELLIISLINDFEYVKKFAELTKKWRHKRNSRWRKEALKFFIPKGFSLQYLSIGLNIICNKDFNLDIDPDVLSEIQRISRPGVPQPEDFIYKFCIKKVEQVSIMYEQYWMVLGALYLYRKRHNCSARKPIRLNEIEDYIIGIFKFQPQEPEGFAKYNRMFRTMEQFRVHLEYEKLVYPHPSFYQMEPCVEQFIRFMCDESMHVPGYVDNVRKLRNFLHDFDQFARMALENEAAIREKIWPLSTFG